MTCFKTSLMVLALCGLPACGAEAPGGDGRDELASSASLSLTAERTSYLPYQRISLLARYEGARVPWLAPEAGEVTVRVHGPGRDGYQLEPHVRYCAGVESEGRPSAAVIDVTTDRSGWVFTAPGEYRVTLQLADGSLASPPLTLTVAEPASAVDVSARAAIAASATFAEFHRFDGGDRLEGDLALATELAEGQSSYREDMRDLLVRHYSRQSVTRGGVVRPPDPDQALRYYDAASATAKTFSKASALRYLRRLERIAPGSAKLDTAAELQALEARSLDLRAEDLQKLTRPR